MPSNLLTKVTALIIFSLLQSGQFVSSTIYTIQVGFNDGEYRDFGFTEVAVYSTSGQLISSSTSGATLILSSVNTSTTTDDYSGSTGIDGNTGVSGTKNGQSIFSFPLADYTINPYFNLTLNSDGSSYLKNMTITGLPFALGGGIPSTWLQNANVKIFANNGSVLEACTMSINYAKCTSGFTVLLTVRQSSLAYGTAVALVVSILVLTLIPSLFLIAVIFFINHYVQIRKRDWKNKSGVWAEESNDSLTSSESFTSTESSSSVSKPSFYSGSSSSLSSPSSLPSMYTSLAPKMVQNHPLLSAHQSSASSKLASINTVVIASSFDRAAPTFVTVDNAPKNSLHISRQSSKSKLIGYPKDPAKNSESQKGNITRSNSLLARKSNNNSDSSIHTNSFKQKLMNAVECNTPLTSAHVTTSLNHGQIFDSKGMAVHNHTKTTGGISSLYSLPEQRANPHISLHVQAKTLDLPKQRSSADAGYLVAAAASHSENHVAFNNYVPVMQTSTLGALVNFVPSQVQTQQPNHNRRQSVAIMQSNPEPARRAANIANETKALAASHHLKSEPSLIQRHAGEQFHHKDGQDSKRHQRASILSHHAPVVKNIGPRVRASTQVPSSNSTQPISSRSSSMTPEQVSHYLNQPTMDGSHGAETGRGNRRRSSNVHSILDRQSSTHSYSSAPLVDPKAVVNNILAAKSMSDRGNRHRSRSDY